MAIVPDAKDWTWVLEEVCPECGFGHRSDGATFTVDSFARYFLHDPVHHLNDVARGNSLLDAPREP